MSRVKQYFCLAHFPQNLFYNTFLRRIYHKKTRSTILFFGAFTIKNTCSTILLFGAFTIKKTCSTILLSGSFYREKTVLQYFCLAHFKENLFYTSFVLRLMINYAENSTSESDADSEDEEWKRIRSDIFTLWKCTKLAFGKIF